MDRNLGALDDRYHEITDRKEKYYQFGRKDPFNSDIHCWAYDAEIFVPTKSSKANGRMISKKKSEIDGPGIDGFNTEGHNVPYAISHPVEFIYSDSVWSSSEDLFGGVKLEDNKTTKYWNDPRPFIRLENEEVFSNVENKSFFDPCPIGWRLPINGWMDGFRGDSSGDATGDVNMNFQYGVDSAFADRGPGRTYVPLGYLSQKGNKNAQTAFCPATGARRGPSGGVITYNSDYCFLWSSTPAGTGNGSCLFTDSNVQTSRSICRSYGNPIRCIKE